MIFDSVIYKEDLKKTIQGTINFNNINHSSVLITGATGLIGSYLVDTLLEANSLGYDIRIIATGRDLKRLRARFKTDNQNLIFIELNITKEIILKEKVDYVIHAASNASPSAIMNDPLGTILCNIEGCINLLNFCNYIDVKKFLFVSTGEVYGKRFDDTPTFDENYSGIIDFNKTRSCYPCSKRLAENLCISYLEKYGVDVVITRLSHTYGPNVTDSDDRATAQFFRTAIKRQPIVLNSTGEQIRSYTYISDCVSGILTVLINGYSGEAYNIASPISSISIADFAKTVGLLADVPVSIKKPTINEMRLASPFHDAVLNSKKLMNLGWESTFSPEDGISHVLKILNSQQN